MNVKNIKKLIVSLLVLFAFSSAATVFAFFGTAQDKDYVGSVGANSATVTVDTFEQLLAYGKGGYFNKGGISSPSDSSVIQSGEDITVSGGDRYTIKLGADVTLKDNLFITADCHIDMNGKTINMNGKVITFIHGYEGTTQIFNGTLSGDSVYVYVYYALSVGKMMFTNVNYKVGLNVSADSSIYTYDISNNQKYAAYSAIFEAFSCYSPDEGGKLNRKTFLEISDESLDLSLPSTYFAPQYCGYVSGNEICAAVSDTFYADLPLVYWKNSAVKLSYLLDGQSYYGAAMVAGEHVITVSAVCGGVSASVQLKVHSINSASGTEVSGAALGIIKNYLSQFYSATDDKYVLANGITLPKKLSAGGLITDIEYITYKTDGVTDANSKITSDENGSVYFITLSSEAALLTVKITYGGTTYTFSGLKIQRYANQSTETNYSIAKEFLALADTLTITDSDTGVNGYTYILLKTNADIDANYVAKGITGVSYTLIYNYDDIYAAGTFTVGATEHYGLTVSADRKTEPALSSSQVYLNATVTFSDASAVEFSSAVKYVKQGSGGTNIASFIPYYNVLNRQLDEKLVKDSSCYNFKLPLNVKGGFPPVVYSVEYIYAVAPAALPTFTLSLFYNGTDNNTQTVQDGNVNLSSWKTYFENNYAAIKAASDTAWHFTFDVTSIPTSDCEVKLYYNYSESVDVFSWKVHSYKDVNDVDVPITSSFTLYGLIRQGTGEAVEDANLYSWMYLNFNTQSDTVYNVGADYVLTYWLNEDVDFNNSGNNLSVSSYKGMEYLKGTSKVTLSSAGITADDLYYVAKMQALTKLVLNNNALNENSSTSIGGTQTDIFALLSKSKIEILYLNNDESGATENTFRNFENLPGLQYLTDVYVYNNVPSGAESLFSGSQGIVNVTPYQSLTERGVNVYNGYASGTPQLFANLSSANDYINLLGIEYQKKIPLNADVRNVYKYFSTNYNDYGVAGSYTYNSSVYSVSNQSITFGYLGSDPTTSSAFTITYSFTLNGSNYSIVVKFNVERLTV